MAASQARRGNQTELDTDDFFFDGSQIGNETQANQNEEKSGHKRLSAFDVSQMVVEKKIKTSTELLALANNQKSWKAKLTLQSSLLTAELRS